MRDDENQACQNCGQIGHRKYDCPEKQNYTANIICRVCGNAGHMARDCPDRQRGASWRNDGPMGAKAGGRFGSGDAVDREYEVCSLPQHHSRNRRVYANLRHSNSCKNSVALALLLRALKPGLDPSSPVAPLALAAEAMLDPGHVDRQAVLLPGVPETMAATPMVLLLMVPPVVPLVVLPPGLASVSAIGITTVAIADPMVVTEVAMEAAMGATTTVVRTSMAAPQLPLEPLLGSNPWLLKLRTVDTRATALTALLVLLREWAALLLACPLRLLVARHLASLAD